MGGYDIFLDGFCCEMCRTADNMHRTINHPQLAAPTSQYKTEPTVCLPELSYFDVDVAGQNVCQFFHGCQSILAELKPQDHVATTGITWLQAEMT